MNASVPLVGEAHGERGFVVAQRVSGERALPVAGRMVLLSQERLCRHLLVCGATGAGKTETLLRLAWTVAKSSDAPVFYLDGKGDRENAERFTGLMADAGRHTRVFPNEPFDGWRGEAHEIQGRLMEIIDYASEGPAAWYRDVAKTTLRLVCEHPDGPPRSSAQVLMRMDHALLTIAHPGSSAVAALTPAQVGQVRLRYEAFFGQVRGQLDGSWAWEDTTAGYVLLDSLTLSEEVGGLARFLFEDFMGMGGAEETARILGSVETVIAHRVNTPDEIVALAGTRKIPELTTRLAEDGLTRERSVRMEHQLTIDPNKVRALNPGMAYLISHGRAMKIQIPQTPALRTSLPQPSDPAGKDVPGDIPFAGTSSDGIMDLPF